MASSSSAPLSADEQETLRLKMQMVAGDMYAPDILGLMRRAKDFRVQGDTPLNPYMAVIEHWQVAEPVSETLLTISCIGIKLIRLSRDQPREGEIVLYLFVKFLKYTPSDETKPELGELQLIDVTFNPVAPVEYPIMVSVASDRQGTLTNIRGHGPNDHPYVSGIRQDRHATGHWVRLQESLVSGILREFKHFMDTPPSGPFPNPREARITEIDCLRGRLYLPREVQEMRHEAMQEYEAYCWRLLQETPNYLEHTWENGVFSFAIRQEEYIEDDTRRRNIRRSRLARRTPSRQIRDGSPSEYVSPPTESLFRMPWSKPRADTPVDPNAPPGKFKTKLNALFKKFSLKE